MTISIQELGDHVKAARQDKKLSQALLAESLPTVNRSQIAHLEQGLRVPEEHILRLICEHLHVPTKYWVPFTDDSFRQQLEFEEALSEMAGHPVTLRFLDEQASHVATKAIGDLFAVSRNQSQALDAFNAILVFYGIPRMTSEFFERYLGVEATKSTQSFLEGVRKFQAEAIRLYSTFKEGYVSLNEAGTLRQHLAPLEARDVGHYHNREPWAVIEEIEEERLPDLGYISAKQALTERSERTLVAEFLIELANKLEDKGPTATAFFSEKKRRKMGSLLRKFDSRLEHDFISPLFTPDSNALRREAEAIKPKADDDLKRIEETQAKAQRNLARYLAADHLDVYVATSMRVDADFVSVNQFSKKLFTHTDVKGLHLRHFNPTQSWIDDRVAKGLVEALMLRRASLTIYMAQKSDTFGKDSEASVALGQGKAVIVFVPKLLVPSVDLDSERIGDMSRADLETSLAKIGTSEDAEDDPTMDHEALASRLMTLKLVKLEREKLAPLVRNHWADFDLYGEDNRIRDITLREEYRLWLDAVVRENHDTTPSDEVREQLIGILVATATRFESRAKLFREIHPLALQVILSTGVLNGILVARSVESCAALVEALTKNTLSFQLIADVDNYRLVETKTQSTARVISRHTLVTNAFSAFYSGRVREP